MGRRVANFTPLENGELTLYAVGGLLCGCNDMQRPDTLAVQPSILRETLEKPQKHASVSPINNQK